MSRLRPHPPAAAAAAGHHEQPRERLWRHGPGALTDAELLAVVLGTGVPGCGVLALAHELLQDHGGLRGLLAAEPRRLSTRRGIGTAKASQIGAVLELARRSLAEDLRREDSLNRPELMRTYCASLLAHREVEVCLGLFLDNQLRLIQCEELSQGTLAQAALYPREVVRAALRHHAAAVVLAHNHPSGVARASESDLLVTRQVARALELIDARLLDHIIVAGAQTVSMAAAGLLEAGTASSR